MEENSKHLLNLYKYKKNKNNNKPKYGIIGGERINQTIKSSSDPGPLKFNQISYKFIIKA